MMKRSLLPSSLEASPSLVPIKLPRPSLIVLLAGMFGAPHLGFGMGHATARLGGQDVTTISTCSSEAHNVMEHEEKSYTIMLAHLTSMTA